MRASLGCLLLACTAAVHALDSNLLRILGPQAVNLWKLEKISQADNQIFPQAVPEQNPLSASAREEFPEQWFTQPLDHFDKKNNHTFAQRYWVNKRHYKPGTGGPVIVLDGGETSGVVRILVL